MGYVVREMQDGVRQVLCEDDLKDIGMCFSKCCESVFSEDRYNVVQDNAEV